ncbi:hypothetical protein ElyMa_004751000 [Elysia marginata]|uniref:Uncharacterized protein n=1 Tax=Elysia marginata TaxID=1093978 RepID=A0AAV4IDE3_9GAST|nr:hypothetical protein ElyMa_004751000 [Elysia marginata]
MVRQEFDKFMKGGQVHHHAADTGTAAKAKLVRDVKEKAVLNPFQSTYTIAEPLVTEVERVPNQRPIDYPGRIRNRRRQQGRPNHPKTLDFQLDMEHVPTEFELADIEIGNRRHLLFFTKRQMDLLKKSLLVFCGCHL